MSLLIYVSYKYAFNVNCFWTFKIVICDMVLSFNGQWETIDNARIALESRAKSILSIAEWQMTPKELISNKIKSDKWKSVLRSSTLISKSKSEILSMFTKLKRMNLAFPTGRMAWTKAKPEKTVKPLSRDWNPAGSCRVLPGTKSPLCPTFLFCKEKL